MDFSAPATLTSTTTPVPASESPIGASSSSSSSSSISIITYTTPMTDPVRSPSPGTTTLTSTTLLTSASPSDSAASSISTATPNYWGWSCNGTNSTGQIPASVSGAGCTETFMLPSSTKININLTEPTATGNDNSSEPTRTFVPGDFPGAAPRGLDASFGGVAGWAGLMVVVGVWMGLI